MVHGWKGDLLGFHLSPVLNMSEKHRGFV